VKEEKVEKLKEKPKEEKVEAKGKPSKEADEGGKEG